MLHNETLLCYEKGCPDHECFVTVHNQPYVISEGTKVRFVRRKEGDGSPYPIEIWHIDRGFQLKESEVEGLPTIQ